MKDPNALINQLLIQKYGKGNPELIDQLHYNSSQRWNDIQQQASIIISQPLWEIGDDAQVPIPLRFWWKLAKPLPQPLCRVNQLRDSSDRWNNNLVIAIYGLSEGKEVLNTSHSYYRAKDWLTWTRSTNGFYLVKKGY